MKELIALVFLVSSAAPCLAARKGSRTPDGPSRRAGRASVSDVPETAAFLEPAETDGIRGEGLEPTDPQPISAFLEPAAGGERSDPLSMERRLASVPDAERTVAAVAARVEDRPDLVEKARAEAEALVDEKKVKPQS